MLKEGTKAPAFSLPDQTGTTRTLTDYAGKWVLLYFYPKDLTPGCTVEACSIRDIYADFEAANITVLGVSKDTAARHGKFIAAFNLPFTLLSDTTGEMITSYEAMGEKSMFGKKYVGILRVSYLIDPEGIIRKVYPKVKPAEHAQEVLEDKKRATI
jgi:peroxiredoxin Q/BCP